MSHARGRPRLREAALLEWIEAALAARRTCLNPAAMDERILERQTELLRALQDHAAFAEAMMVEDPEICWHTSTEEEPDAPRDETGVQLEC
jgi:hypothetical protein